HARFLAIGEPGWAAYSLFSGLGMIVFFVFASMGFLQRPGFVDVAGIYQRLSATTGLLGLIHRDTYRSGEPRNRIGQAVDASLRRARMPGREAIPSVVEQQSGQTSPASVGPSAVASVGVSWVVQRHVPSTRRTSGAGTPGRH